MEFGIVIEFLVIFMFVLYIVNLIAEVTGIKKTKRDKINYNIDKDMLNQQHMHRMMQEEADRLTQEEAIKSVTPFEMGGYDTSNQMNDINNSMNNFNNFNNF